MIVLMKEAWKKSGTSDLIQGCFRMNYMRKAKEATPVLVICYDFDKTLTPDDMQTQGYIQSVGYDVKRLWEETDALAH